MRCYPFFYVLLVLLLLSALPSAALDSKTLCVGDSEIYEFDQMTTAIVGSPAVADIVPLSAHRLLVNAKGVGETTLFVYDRRGKHRYRLTVVLPMPQLGALAAQVQTEIGLPTVTVRVVKDTLFLEGTVTSVVSLQRAGAIAGVYALKLRNLISLNTLPDATAGLSLAQTYAALLTNTLSGTGIKVQVIDDKTIALVGQYLSSIPGIFGVRGSVAAARPDPESQAGQGRRGCRRGLAGRRSTSDGSEHRSPAIALGLTAERSPGSTAANPAARTESRRFDQPGPPSGTSDPGACENHRHRPKCVQEPRRGLGQSLLRLGARRQQLFLHTAADLIRAACRPAWPESTAVVLPAAAR